jgi:cell division protein DivIC
MVRNRQSKTSATVKSIQTEYVRSLQIKEERRRARKVRLYRRLTVFVFAAVLILAVLTHTFIQQKQALVTKEQQKMELLAQLTDVQEEQVMLKKQLVKLNDDEYIAKLARQQYFLSHENEIIFSTPEKNKNTSEKEDEKE